MDISEWIRSNRLRQGWTQGHLASLIGCSSPLISFWETGRTVPSDSWLALLAQAFDSDLPETEAGTSLGDLIRAAREASNWTRADLAEHAGLTYQTVLNVEEGNSTNPREDTLRRLNQVLELGIYEEDEDDEVGAHREDESTPDDGSSVAGSSISNMVDVLDPNDLAGWPASPGVYVLYNEESQPVYIGTSGGPMRERVRNHFEKFWFKAPVVQTGGFFIVEDDDDRRQLEKALIRVMGGYFLINRNERRRGDR